MRILDRYIIDLFLKTLLFCILFCVVIFVIVNLFEKLDSYVDKKVPPLVVVQFYLYQVPYIVILVLPVAMILATLFVMNQLNKYNELTAMKACGLSLYRILSPMFITSLGISLVALYFGSFLIPYSNQKRLLIERTKIDKLPPIDYQNRSNVFYIGEGGRMYYIGYYDGRNKTLRDIVIQEFGNGTLLKRIDAKNGVWDSKTKQWKFKDGFVRFFENENEKERVIAFNDTVFSYITEKPEDFSREEKEPENMTYPELVDYIRRIKHSGDDASKELTELYLRISFPLANFIIVLFGAPMSSSGGGRRGGVAIGFGISLLTSFVFYGCIKTGQSLGHAGKLDPILSAWLANIIFGIGGIIALIKAKK